MDVCECDLMDVHAHSKFSDKYRYILSVINVFSTFLHLVSLKSNREPSWRPKFGLYSMTLNILNEDGDLPGCAQIRAKHF